MKRLLELLNKCQTDEEVKNFTDAVIEYYTKESIKDNKGRKIIGALVGISPCEGNSSDIVEHQNTWAGFVFKGVKMVYGSYTNYYECTYSKGSYYYVDDDSYIYEFVKYIKGKEVEDLNEFILCVYRFLKDFLEKYVNYLDRDEIHQLIYKSDDLNFFKPIKEHSIKDFYHNGSAMCTEYSLMGCNLLSIFGVTTMIIMDKYHAFNIVIDEKGQGLILDMSDIVLVKDLKGRIVTTVPFLEDIEEFDGAMINKFIYEQQRIEYEDYDCVYINDSLFKKPTGITRSYGIDNENVKSKSLILQ